MINVGFAKSGGEEQDILIIPTYQGVAKITGLPEEFSNKLKARLENKDFLGKNGETVSELIDHQKVIFVGLGERAKLTLELSKTAGAKAHDALGQAQSRQVGLFIEKSIKLPTTLKIIEGLFLKNYLDVRYKTGEELEDAQKKLLDNLTVIGSIDAKFKKEVSQLQKIIDAVFLVRDLVSAPPVDMRPEDLAKEAEKLAKAYSNLTYKSLGRKEIAKEGLGLLAAVNRGSTHQPRLIILQLNPDKKDKPIVLVGKGLTFDSGGYNLKPAEGMRRMHLDMAGGATVLGIIKALASLNTKKQVIGIVPATENLISGDAYKPSDIIKSHSGQTVEIENTDAEGRLILADALSYAIKEFEPSLVIDLATLTGACVVALGERYAGIFSNRPEIVKKLEQASRMSGEKVWALPLDDKFRKIIKSQVADLGNIGKLGRYAGASTAAAFLSYFVGDTPWAHIDIAGPHHQDKELEPWNPPSGATGFGVRLLTELISAIIK